jgi:hypothetical protein
MKQSDRYCLPLSVDIHRKQTLWKKGEEDFWSQYGGIERAKRLANDLYECTGQTEKALKLIAEWRMEISQNNLS